MNRQRPGRESSRGLSSDELIEDFLQSVDLQFNVSSAKALPIERWVQGIKLPTGPFST